MSVTALLLAFTVGLLSTVHCVSMCGGIMGALAFGLPPERRARLATLVPFLFAYNLGRVGSYVLIGALIGGFGGMLLGNGTAHAVLRWFAGLMMVAIGLYLAGWFPRFVSIERLGVPVWRRLQPLGRWLLPVQTWHRALLYGAVWGWLPCGLVYSMALSSAGQFGALNGGLYMGAFGLGTVLPVVTAGAFAGRAGQLRGSPRLNQLGGLIIICLGLLTLLFPGIGAPDALSVLCTPDNLDIVPTEHEHL